MTQEISDGLFVIDLPQKHPDLQGFHHFISAYFFKDAMGRRVLVDPGPANTIPLLNRELEKLTDGIDLVLLTHIHMDHAGGVGQFNPHWSNNTHSPCYLLHKRGFKHLRAPEKLWNASLQTLGPVAEMYGMPVSLTAPLIEQDDKGIIEVFETPGHAPHHISLRVEQENGRKLFFVGETIGIACPTLAKGSLWIRPATPHKFDPTAETKSLDLLENILHGDELLCLAHWGTNENPKKCVQLAREQLQYWTDVIASMRDRDIKDIVSYLMQHDPRIQAPIAEDLRERERIFMANSVNGILKAL